MFGVLKTIYSILEHTVRPYLSIIVTYIPVIRKVHQSEEAHAI